MLTSKQIQQLNEIKDKNAEVLCWSDTSALVKIPCADGYEIKTIWFEDPKSRG